LVQSPEELTERLLQNHYDIVLADYELPNWSGLDALAQMRQLGLDIPFLLVTGTLGEELMVECLRQGVTDYVLRERLARLPAAVRRALEEKALRENRSRAEQSLRESEAGFRLLFANNPLPMWVYDWESLRFLQVNDAAIAHYGYSREEFLQMCITDIRLPEDVPRLLKELAKEPRAVRFSGPWRHRLKDGRIIDVEIIAHTLDFAGRPAALIVAQDITERKRAEAENTRLITAIEQSAEGVMITDTGGRIQYVNPAFTKMTGYSREEVMGRDPRLLKSSQQGRALYEQLWKTILAGDIWRGEIINRRKDGSLYTEELGITPVRDERGTVTHFIAIKQDVTERRRAEEALRRSEARNRELVENALYGIYRATLLGQLLYANPALVKMLGYDSQEELLSRKLPTEIYRNSADRAQIIERYKQLGRVDGAEVEWTRKDGSIITVRLSGRAVAQEPGGAEEMEVIVEDVTERRAMEKQIHQVRKFEAIGQLAGGIAHDFNNVIGAMLGWAELGMDQAPAESPLRRNFQRIREQAERAAGLTRQLLAFARRHILEPRNINLNHTVADLLSMLERVIGSDVELKVVAAPDLGVVRADPGQLEQVLMNLCLNARDAMPGGGRLMIETQNVEMGEQYTQIPPYVPPGRYVRLSVSDTGVGMDAATRERIFEPFFTTKEPGKGTGLGLATVYGVVRQHGGFVHVDSEPGRGTTFHVFLPASEGPLHEKAKKEIAQTEPVRGGTETLLVAEDHDGVREMARATLEGLGYRLLLARDGDEALQTFLAHRDKIALVLLDVVMPKLDGRGLYAQMRAVKPEISVLFTTGYTVEVAALSALVEKGVPVLQKPYTPAQLGRKVREALDHVTPAPTTGPASSSHIRRGD
jgi:PAS domain S-box-containing protein